MTKLRATPLKNCTKNVLNDGGADTLGNILCSKLAWNYNGNPPLDQMQDGVEIGFYHSECEKEWTPTGNPEGPLKVPRKLCCIKDEPTGRFLHVKCRGKNRTPIYSCDVNDA